MTDTWDAIVVGAGPAGMAAATRLAAGGARTLIVDEQAGPGGQIYRAVERNAAHGPLRAILGESYAHGEGLAKALRQSGAITAFGTSVWRIEKDRRVWTRDGTGRIGRHAARHLVLATGAIERPVPVRGWTLPGVMTVGALQILMKTAGLRPDVPVVLAGSGPLLYLFASQCAEAGVKDLTVVSTASFANGVGGLAALPRALTGEGPAYLQKGLAMLAALRRRGVRVISQARLLGIDRTPDGKLLVGCESRGRWRTIRCGLVGLHEGVIPHQHPARSIGCAHLWDDTQAAFRPELDDAGRTSVADVHIAGDAGGIVGAIAAEHAGRLAALAILRAQDRLAEDAHDREAADERRVRDRHTAVRPFLDRLYRPRPEVFRPADDTIVCRCEAVTAGAIREAARERCLGPNQAKAYLRVGMGPCQGRMCAPTVAALIAAETGRDMDATGTYRVRPPLKPVTLGELAALGGDET